MQTLSLDRPIMPAPSGRLGWRALAAALKGDALAAFPAEAVERDVIVQRFLGRCHILLQHPEAIRHVLIDNAANYRRAPVVRRVLRPMFGDGLFLSEGEAWRRQRHAVAPAFAPRALHVLAPRIVAATEAFAAELAAGGGAPIDLVPRLQLLALNIIGRAVFSLDMARYGSELRSLIIDYAARLSRPGLADYLLPLAVPTVADIGRARFRRRWRRMVGCIVAERSKRPGVGAPGDLPRDLPRDLFDMLAAADADGDAGADPARLADQVATLVVAGHETTAAALFWTLYLLARHPEAQRRLAAEADAAAPDPDNAAAALPQLSYARAVIDEALRLYPPAFVIVRQAAADDAAAGIAVPAGSLVLIAPWVLHRHRRWWRAPELFDPQRFLPGAPPPPRFAYMPFGAGPRVCVGAPFALTELVLVVASLLRVFEFRLARPGRVTPVGGVTLQPAAPPLFALTPRTRFAPCEVPGKFAAC